MLDTRITILMPVYNEKNLINPALEEIDTFMGKHFSSYEILMIESGSTDGTKELCDELSGQYPNLRVIHEEGRNGFGSAVKLGYRNARMDYVWLITADMPFALEHILTAVPLLSQYDFVLSYRSEDSRSIFRRFQSIVYNLLCRWRFGIRVKSVNSAFRLLPTQEVANMEILSQYWFIDCEVLCRLIRAGKTYAEIPVPLIDRTQGKSTVGAGTFLQTLEELNAFARIYKAL